MRPYVIDAVVEIEDPVQRLLRRGDVVRLGAEHNDRRTDIAQVQARTIGRSDVSRSKLVADEQLIDDELHFCGVEQYMAAPPLLEFEIARRLGVDLRVEVVVLRPERVGGVEVLEVADQPRAVKLAVA